MGPRGEARVAVPRARKGLPSPPRFASQLQLERLTTSSSKEGIDVAKREVIVSFARNMTTADISRKITEWKASIIETNEILHTFRLRLPDSVSVAEFVETENKPSVFEMIEPNHIIRTLGVSSTSGVQLSYWGLEKILTPAAWEIIRGSAEVIVAVLDTGVCPDHPDLIGVLAEGYNFVDHNTDTRDDNGHGTHVSGIIAGVGNRPLGIVGVAAGCRVMPVKVISSSGEGTYADVANGLIYAAKNGAQVINLSIGGKSYSEILARAIEYAESQGSVVVASAGNEGTSALMYPAALPLVVAVTATDQDDTIWPNSNTNDTISISAPGVRIISTGLEEDYVAATGTSASAAFVSSVAALVKSQNPGLAPHLVRRALLMSADDKGENGKDSAYGYGRLNALSALTKANAPIHDLAVIGIGTEPRQIQCGDLVQIHVAIQNQGTVDEQNVELSLLANRTLLGNIGVDTLRVGQTSTVTFSWTAEASNWASNILQLIASLSPVPNEIERRNNQKALNYETDQSGRIYTLYRNIPYVHSWIAVQGLNILPAGHMKNEIQDYLYGGTTYSFLFGSSKVWENQYGIPSSWTADTKKGASILEGAWEEDEDSYGSLQAPVRHFWNPDSRFHDGLDIVLIGEQESNIAQAHQWWNQALSTYSTDKALSYYYLGRVVHFLGDLGVPDHVHNDQHPGDYLGLFSDEDDYSNYEEYTKLFYRDFLGAGEPKLINVLPLSNPDFSDAPSVLDKEFVRLFYNQAQFTQLFDSSDVDGNSKGLGGQSIQMGISTESGRSNRSYPAVDYLDRNSQNEASDVSGDISNDGIDPGTPVTIAWQKLGITGYYDYKPLFEGPDNDAAYYIDLSRGKGQIMYSTSLWNEMNNTFDRLRISYRYRGQSFAFESINPKDSSAYHSVPDRNAKTQMGVLFPENIRYVSGLYRLFWDRTHKTPTITAVSPRSLPTSDVPQLITIYGLNFNPPGSLNPSSLVFFDPLGTAYERIPDKGTTSELSYNITVLAAKGTWKVKVITNGEESDIATFIVDSPSSQPTQINVSATINPGRIKPFESIVVSGTVLYNTGIGVNGTATIDISNNQFSAPVVDGSFSRTITGPGSSGTVTFTVTDGRLTGTSAVPIEVVPDSGTSRYDLETYVVYEYDGDDNSVDYSYKEAFRTTDPWVNHLAIIENASVNEDLDFRWEFFYPDGRQYGAAQELKRAFREEWDWGWATRGFLIKDNDMANVPGRYTINFFINGSRKATKSYVVGWEFSQHKMCKGIEGEDGGVFLPQNITSSFSPDDRRAVAWHEFLFQAQAISVKTEFYDPSGAVYSSSEYTLSDELAPNHWYEWRRHASWINIAGTAAQYMCGSWRVHFYVKNPTKATWDLKYTDMFRIEEQSLPSITVKREPVTPKAGETVILLPTAADNNHLQKVVAHWNAGFGDMSKDWDKINAQTWSSNLTLGEFSPGQEVTYWCEVWDESGNRTESDRLQFAIDREKVGLPQIFPPGGVFNGEVIVTLTTATTGAQLRYTLDGSDPSVISTLYSVPFRISTFADLKVKAFKSGMDESSVSIGRFSPETRLRVELAPDLVLTWDSPQNRFSVQMSTRLNPPLWVDVTSEVQFANGRNTLHLAPRNEGGFYRLVENP